jgi:hypothetical protein
MDIPAIEGLRRFADPDPTARPEAAANSRRSLKTSSCLCVVHKFIVDTHMHTYPQVSFAPN